MKLAGFLILLLISSFATANQSPILFSQNSYHQITENEQSFIMLMWSLDCPPCIDELIMLGEVVKDHPDLNLILVSTDSISRTHDIHSFIEQAGLKTMKSWVFSDISAQHLRYSIDPLWYGELPRSYFHRKNQPRKSVTGRLHKQQIIAWLENN